jgi:transcriptional regulator with XRE-family HTH domain
MNAEPIHEDERTVLTSAEAGRLLKARREERHLTLRQAADQIGISASALSRCENFRHELDADSLSRVARWLNVPLERIRDEQFIYIEGEPLPQVVDVLIFRDRGLDDAGRKALSEIFRTAYRQFAGQQPTETN